MAVVGRLVGGSVAHTPAEKMDCGFGDRLGYGVACFINDQVVSRPLRFHTFYEFATVNPPKGQKVFPRLAFIIYAGILSD